MYLTTVESLGDPNIVVVVKSLYFIGLQNQNFKCRQVAQHLNRTEVVASEIQFSQFRELLVSKHIFEILQVTFLEFQLHHFFTRSTSQIFLQNLISQSTSKVFSGLLMFRAFNRNAIQNF